MVQKLQSDLEQIEYVFLHIILLGPVLFGSPSNVEVALMVDCVCFPGYTGLNCETGE